MERLNKKKVSIVIFLCAVISLTIYYIYIHVHTSEEKVLNSTIENFDNKNNDDVFDEEYTTTGYTWHNKKGEIYPIYLAPTGSCFIVKKSKSGSEYRAYLGEEVSEQIRNNPLSHNKDNNPSSDTIYSFLGKPLILNNKICEQISAITDLNTLLSYKDSIIQIGEVRWRINIQSPKTNIVLYTSIEPDMPQMKKVVDYLNSIYGKPYEEEIDGSDIKWSSSKDPNNIFNGKCTLVHLRRVRSEEGGTFLFFK